MVHFKGYPARPKHPVEDVAWTFGQIVIRDERQRVRVLYIWTTGSLERAKRFRAWAGVGRVERGRVIAEGHDAVGVLDLLGAPEDVLAAIEAICARSGRPGVRRNPADVARQRELVSELGRAITRGVRNLRPD